MPMPMPQLRLVLMTPLQLLLVEVSNLQVRGVNYQSRNGGLLTLVHAADMKAHYYQVQPLLLKVRHLVLVMVPQGLAIPMVFLEEVGYWDPSDMHPIVPFPPILVLLLLVVLLETRTTPVASG